MVAVTLMYSACHATEGFPLQRELALGSNIISLSPSYTALPTSVKVPSFGYQVIQSDGDPVCPMHGGQLPPNRPKQLLHRGITWQSIVDIYLKLLCTG